MLSMGLNTALVGAIILMLPLKTVVPFFLEKNGQDQLITMTPMTRNSTQAELLIESEVRRYIIERHQVIPNDRFLHLRWGSRSFVALRSAPRVYQQFLPIAAQIRTGVQNEPFTRDVEITSMTQRLKDLWAVTFTTIDRIDDDSGESLPLTRTWLAVAQVGRASYGNIPTTETVLANPLQLWIVDYDTSETFDQPSE